MSPVSARQPRVIDIIRAASEVLRVPVDRIMGSSRRASIAYARRVAMFVARADLGLSYPELGAEFGRDHSAVQYAVKRVQDEPNDSTVGRDVQRVRAAIVLEPVSECMFCQHLKAVNEALMRRLDHARRALDGAA